MLRMFLVIALCISLLLHDAAAETDVETCAKVLQTAGASPLFAEHVGHGIHSLTVERLQKFEPSVTVDNKVPTLAEYEISSADVLRLSAPAESQKISSPYLTDGVKVLDSVLGRMDAHLHFEGTTLEQVVHAFHMEELWAHMLLKYQQIKASPPSEVSAVCKCTMDIENNGILQALRVAALNWREPGLMRILIKDKSVDVQNVNDDKKCQLRFDVVKEYQIYSRQLKGLEKKKEEVCGTAAWQKLTDFFKKVDHAYEPALFLFCALNHAQ